MDKGDCFIVLRYSLETRCGRDFGRRECRNRFALPNQGNFDVLSCHLENWRYVQIVAAGCELNLGLHRDWDRWFQRALEMDHAATMRNSRKLFHSIRATGKKPLNASGIVRAAGIRMSAANRDHLYTGRSGLKNSLGNSVRLQWLAVLARVLWAVAADPPFEAIAKKSALEDHTLHRLQCPFAI